jgi:RNA polymerase sigma-70 factor (ECF subfamily)
MLTKSITFQSVDDASLAMTPGISLTPFLDYLRANLSLQERQLNMSKRLLTLVPTEKAPPITESTQDEELIQLIKSDNREAFRYLVTRYQKLVLGLAKKFLSNEEAARDVAQEVFLSFWSERERYEHKGLLKAYLATMTLNRCRNLSRHDNLRTAKSGTIQEQYDEKQDLIESPDEAQIKAENASVIRKALKELPEEPQQVLVLRYFNDYSLEQIADITGLPLGTVKSHVSRGLKKLHAILHKGEQP